MDTHQGTADGLVFAGQAWAGWALGQGQQPGAPTLEPCTRLSSQRSGWWR